MEARGGSASCPVRGSGESPTLQVTDKGSAADCRGQTHQQQQHASAATTSNLAASGGTGDLLSGIASWIPFRSMIKNGVGNPATDSGNAPHDSSLRDGNNGISACPARDARTTNASVSHENSGDSQQGCGCPVKGGDPAPGATTADEALRFNKLNKEYVYGQERAHGQSVPLSTSRQRSSIPKADFNPRHQPENESTWMYPSEQQYYNAIKRKGHQAAAQDMPMTLAIHNAVNEQGWTMVTEWERLHAWGGSGNDVDGTSGGDIPPPKLLRFEGRPKDTSPKAWIKTNLLGYAPPFDRHDWVVKRDDGSEARYVIDFYAGHAPPASGYPVAMHLDVRPALDSVDAVVDRARMFYSKTVRPRLSGVVDAFTASGSTGTDAAGSDSRTATSSGQDAPPSAATGGGVGR